MRSGSSGLLIIVIGLLVIYLGITGRYKCFANFVACVSGDDPCLKTGTNQGSGVIAPLQPLAPGTLFLAPSPKPPSGVQFPVGPTYPQ